MDLTGKQDAGVIPLQLSACCYEEEQKPFKFLLKGVIGKLELYSFTVVQYNVHIYPLHCTVYYTVQYIILLFSIAYCIFYGIPL